MTPKKKTKKVKAWALVNEQGLTWGDVEPVNGTYGAGLSFPNISTNREVIRAWELETFEKIIPCTITYEI